MAAHTIEDLDAAQQTWNVHEALYQTDRDFPSLIEAAVTREVAEGVVPDRQDIKGAVPFNLMKSETLV